MKTVAFVLALLFLISAAQAQPIAVSVEQAVAYRLGNLEMQVIILSEQLKSANAELGKLRKKEKERAEAEKKPLESSGE